MEYDIFKNYEQDFKPDKELEKIEKSKEFRNKTDAEQSAELGRRFIAYLHTIEKDKLYYFMLAHTQAGKVLIVNAPSDKKEQKQFLGYEWSKAKGREGIKYNGGDTVNDIITPLFDPKDLLNNNEKINTAIKRNFIGEITDPLPDHCHYANLTDMLDFTRIDFKKAISLNPKQNIDIETKWELVKLREVCNLQGGNTFEVIYQGNKDKTHIPFFKVSDMNSPENFKMMTVANNYVEETVFNQQIKGTLIGKSSIVFPKVGMSIYTDKKRILGCDSGIDNNIMALSALDANQLIPLFLLEIFDQFIRLGEIASIANPPSISEDNLGEVKIPLPPPKIQKQIVYECDAVDQETEEARQGITAAKQEIEERVQAVINSGHEIKKLGNIADINSGGTPSRKNKAYWENGLIPWLRSEVCKETHISENIDYECITEEGYNNSSAKWLTSDTTLIALVGATKGKTAFLTFVAPTNQNIAGIKSLSQNILDTYIFYCLKSLYHQIIQDLSQYDMLNLTEINNIRISIPPLNIQQQLVEEVEQLEAKITKAQAVIDEATERKNAILTKYL